METPRVNSAVNTSGGQSTVEASLMAVVIATVVSAFLCVIYLLFASYWAEHILYEALICYHERNNKHSCTQEAKRKITSILFLKRNYQFHIEDRGSRYRAHLKIQFKPPFLEPKNFSFMKELKI